MAPGVERIPIRTGKVRGILFIPAGEGPFPGVIDMFGAIPFVQEHRSGIAIDFLINIYFIFIHSFSALLASRGIASLCLPYHDYEDIPTDQLLNLQLEYFEEATEILMDHPKVIGDRCGVFANCLGALIGNFMISYLDKVKAIYGINFPQTTPGIISYKNKTLDDLIISPGHNLDRLNDKLYKPTDKFKILCNQVNPKLHELLRKVAEKDDKHMIYSIGEDDCYEFLNRGIAEMKKNIFDKVPGSIQLKIHPEAGHLYDAPYDRSITESFMKMFFFNEEEGKLDFQEGYQTWGGNDKANVDMQIQVWQEALPFFF